MRFVRHVLVASSILACTSSTSPSERTEDAPQAHGEPCEATAEGTGVKITIRSASCDYDHGSSAKFDYEITTTDSVPPIEVAQSSSCGSCRKLSPAISAWADWRIEGTSDAGQSQRYCLCDTGCCAPDVGGTYQPETGTFRDTISWSGRTWSGPSDTGQKEGSFFAPGRYDVEVTFAGRTTAKLSFVVRE